MRLATLATLALALAAARPAAAQRRVVVTHDEWTLDDCCIAAGGANGAQFALNARGWLTGGAPGAILVYSAVQPGIADPGLAALMATGGYGWTVSTSPADWANRASYAAIFVTGTTLPDVADLVSYVEGGGSVLLMGGTGKIGNEHAYWEPFLSRFGLAFDGPGYNGVSGTLSTAGYDAQGPFGAALFAGVASLYQNNGNTILDAALPADVTRQRFLDGQQRGLYAAAQLAAPTPTSTPEPATTALLAAGLAALALAARRRRALGG